MEDANWVQIWGEMCRLRGRIDALRVVKVQNFPASWVEAKGNHGEFTHTQTLSSCLILQMLLISIGSVFADTERNGFGIGRH